MKILVAVDFSDITGKVLQHAQTMGLALSAQVTLLHVVEAHPDQNMYDLDPANIPIIDPSEIRDQIAQRFHSEHQKLQQHAEQLRNSKLDCKALMVQGETVDVLLEQSEKLDIDFIIAGSHAKGFISQLLLGSTSEALLKQSPRPVYLVPVDRPA